MTNTKGTNAEVEERIQYAVELLLTNKYSNRQVVLELQQKYKKSLQTHRGDVREANAKLHKDSRFTTEELQYYIKDQLDGLTEAYQIAKESKNVSWMIGIEKVKNQAINNIIKINVQLEEPIAWQNAQDNEAKRQSFGGIDRLEKEDHLYVHPWYEECKKQDELPF